MICGKLGAARLLVNAGANLDAPDGSGATALLHACMNASKKDAYITMAEFLISAGADVHNKADSIRLFGWIRLQMTTRTESFFWIETCDLRQPALAVFSRFLPS